MKKYQAKLKWALFIILVLYAGFKIYKKTIAPKMEFQSTVLTTMENKNITLNDFKDQVVIVSFFQSWCHDCASETPVLNELADSIDSSKFKVIYISDEDRTLITKFQTRFPSNNILFTQSSKSLSSLGIAVYPTTYLLNKKGVAVMSKLEGYDWLKEKSRVEKLLNE